MYRNLMATICAADITNPAPTGIDRRRATVACRGLLGLALLLLTPEPGAGQGAGGTVRGVVTEAGSPTPLGGTLISVDGSRASAVSTPDGRFVLRNIGTGTVTIRFRHLGHQTLIRTVDMSANAELTMNVALVPTTTRLDAVVTTATGDQSRRSFGNVVNTVNADSVVLAASIANVNELLQARVPGGQVMQGAGQVGSYGTIRIRGTSSLSLTNEPLIIVDGIRIDNNYGAGNQVLVNNSAAINPEEIASVDVLKGPSASALYGTAAANGVLVIKTKRGQQGPTRWNVTVEGGQIDQPASFPSNYRSWGRNLVNGVPGATTVQCKVADQSLGRCVQDSLTTFNPWMNPETRPFATSPRYQIGLNASGGSEQLTYFFAVEQVQETGPFRMPDIEVARLTAARGVAPTSEQIRPNELQQTSLRGNFTFPLGRTMRMALSTGYSDKTTSNMLDGSIIAGLSQQMFFAPGFRNALNGNSAQYTGDIMSVTSSRRDQRFTGSTQLMWQPISWLTGRGVVGLDQVAGNAYRFSRLNQGTVGGWGPPGQTGGKLSDRSSVSRYSVDLGLTAEFALTSSITSKTSVGAQWFKDTRFETIAQGYTLPPVCRPRTAPPHVPRVKPRYRTRPTAPSCNRRSHGRIACFSPAASARTRTAHSDAMPATPCIHASQPPMSSPTNPVSTDRLREQPSGTRGTRSGRRTARHDRGAAIPVRVDRTHRWRRGRGVASDLRGQSPAEARSHDRDRSGLRSRLVRATRAVGGHLLQQVVPRCALQQRIATQLWRGYEPVAESRGRQERRRRAFRRRHHAHHTLVVMEHATEWLANRQQTRECR